MWLICVILKKRVTSPNARKCCEVTSCHVVLYHLYIMLCIIDTKNVHVPVVISHNIPCVTETPWTSTLSRKSTPRALAAAVLTVLTARTAARSFCQSCRDERWHCSVVVPKSWISEMCPLFHRCLLLYLSILIYLSLLLALVILVLCSCCFCCLRRCFFFFWFRQLRNFVAQPNLCRLQRATPGYRTPTESHAIATPPEPVSEEKHNSQRGKILYQGLNYRDYKP